MPSSLLVFLRSLCVSASFLPVFAEEVDLFDHHRVNFFRVILSLALPFWERICSYFHCLSKACMTRDDLNANKMEGLSIYLVFLAWDLPLVFYILAYFIWWWDVVWLAMYCVFLNQTRYHIYSSWKIHMILPAGTNLKKILKLRLPSKKKINIVHFLGQKLRILALYPSLADW